MRRTGAARAAPLTDAEQAMPAQRRNDVISHDPGRELSAAGMVDRSREAGGAVSTPHSARASCGASRQSTSPKHRTMRPSSRSRRRKQPGWTSSPTARSGAKAIRTGSPPRSRASTSTIPAPRSTAAATPIRCRASSGRSGASTPSRSMISGSCRRTRADDQDHGARTVHDVPAGAERVLRGSARRRRSTTPRP